MTVPNIPPNKFTSVLWSARLINDANLSQTLAPDAVNVSSVAASPIDPGYVRFTLTQPVPLQIAALGANIVRAVTSNPPNYGYTPGKGSLILNAAGTLVIAVDVEGYTSPEQDAITWCIDTTPR